jgi:hypothetical protein
MEGRTMTTRVALGALLLIGCADDRPVPECEPAIQHYYGAGCGYIDTAMHRTLTMSDMIFRCESYRGKRSCRPELGDWLRCSEAVPSPTSSPTQCDCLAELGDLERCFAE